MNEVQVIVTALARDPEIHLDILSIIGASAALMISDIPWDGPIGAVRVGFIDGEFVINPTVTQMAASTLDLRMAGTADAILMVEAGADELPEDMMLEALKLGHEAMQPIIELQNKMRAELGKPKFVFTPVLSDPTVEAAAVRLAGRSCPRCHRQEPRQGSAVQGAGRARKPPWWPPSARRYEPKALAQAFESIEKKVVRERILGDKIRPDGRDHKEIRPISVEVGILPRVHGTGLFTRGETQVLTIATLGTPGDAQKLDTLTPKTPSATCTTTTSRPSPPARSPRCAAPSAARSGTARWPSGRWSR